MCANRSLLNLHVTACFTFKGRGAWLMNFFAILHNVYIGLWSCLYIRMSCDPHCSTCTNVFRIVRLSYESSMMPKKALSCYNSLGKHIIQKL